MSYILDAIRKSDMQRQRGAAPTLLTSHEPSAAPGRTVPLVYWMLAAVLLVVGVAIGWLRPWQNAPAPPAIANNVATPPAAAPVPALLPPAAPPELLRKVEHEAAAAKPAAPSPAPAASAPAPVPSKAPAPATTPAPSQAVALPAPAAAAPAATAIAPVPVPALVAPGSVKPAAEAAPESKIINFADLPPNIRDEIPRMSIAVHAYSREPKNRLVTIDNRLLHEGDDAGPGIRLQQITPDGMVFDYKGYHFRRSVQDVVNNR
jgi:general secretion pathway protein B